MLFERPVLALYSKYFDYDNLRQLKVYSMRCLSVPQPLASTHFLLAKFLQFPKPEARDVTRDGILGNRFNKRLESFAMLFTVLSAGGF
jgi:hypothetical protein